MIIDKYSIIKYYEIYSDKLNSLKNEMNYSSEIDTIKKNLIIRKNYEDEIIENLQNLINKDKNRLLEDINKRYENLENMVNDQEDMEIDDENNENNHNENDY